MVEYKSNSLRLIRAHRARTRLQKG